MAGPRGWPVDQWLKSLSRHTGRWPAGSEGESRRRGAADFRSEIFEDCLYGLPPPPPQKPPPPPPAGGGGRRPPSPRGGCFGARGEGRRGARLFLLVAANRARAAAARP